MDLKGWKKVKEDKKSCTLVHPKGHTMTIAIKALPKIMQEQIKRLSLQEGGAVLMPDKEKARQVWDGAQNGEMRRLKGYLGIGDDKQETPKKQPDQTRQNYAGGDEVLADPGADTVPETSDTVRVAPPSQPAPPPVVVNNILPNGAPPAAAPAPIPAKPQINFQPQEPVAAEPNMEPPVAQTPLKNTLPKDMSLMRRDQTPDLPAAVQQGQEAGKKQAEIESAIASDQAQATKENMANINAIALRRQQNFEDLSAHADSLAKNMHEIDPKHFQNSMSGGSKVATGIGLFLGGLGVPFGGHNYAADFLNKQIDRDIETQKANNENQKTIWGAYKDLYGDSKVADDMTALALKDYMGERMKQAALKQGTPQAWANYQKWLSNYMQERQESLIKNSGRLGILQTGGGEAPQAGPAAPGGKANPKSIEAPKNPTYKILAPDADRKIMGVKYTPLAKDEDKIQAQFQQARQAEKLLNGPNNDGVGGVHDLLVQMHQAAKSSGVYGHLHRTAGEALESVPVVGQAGAALSGALPATTSENKFNNAQVQIETDMATALNGLMTPTEIHKLVQKISPTVTDSEKDIAMKEKTLTSSIIKAVRGGGGGYLDQAGLWSKEKQ